MTITVGGSNITFPDATTQSTAFTGGVTSAVAGNGVAVSASTGAVTFSASCPSFNSVGSYCFVSIDDGTGATTISSGSNYSAGGGYTNNVTSYYIILDNGVPGEGTVNNLSGTWKWMSATGNISSAGGYLRGIACRVA